MLTPARILACWALLAALLPGVDAGAADKHGQYLTRAEFLEEAFGTAQPESAVIWFDDELREMASAILGHPPTALRLRYWKGDAKTAWIIDEIGKEQPITFGVVIANGVIESLSVLQFRESRGWEIRYPFFTRQFEAVQLTESGALNRRIDGISGATLSVKAASRVAKLALALDEFTTPKEKN